MLPMRSRTRPTAGPPRGTSSRNAVTTFCSQPWAIMVMRIARTALDSDTHDFFKGGFVAYSTAETGNDRPARIRRFFGFRSFHEGA